MLLTGVEAVLSGASTKDDALLAETTRTFDNLYRHYCKERSFG